MEVPMILRDLLERGIKISLGHDDGRILYEDEFYFYIETYEKSPIYLYEDDMNPNGENYVAVTRYGDIFNISTLEELIGVFMFCYRMKKFGESKAWMELAAEYGHFKKVEKIEYVENKYDKSEDMKDNIPF